jgi:two-component system sensor kinase
MAIRDKTLPPPDTGARRRLASAAAQPAFAAVAVFGLTFAAMLATQRWLDSTRLFCLAAAVFLAASTYVLVRAYRDAHLAGARGDANKNGPGVSEARMLAIIRSSMEAIVTIDEHQRIIIFNPMAEQVFGCPAMDAVGAPLDRFIPERFRTAHARHVEQFGVTRVSDRQMGKQRVLWGLRANGEEFPLEASISQISDGSARLYTVMLRDITERVKAERAQQEARDELRELSANLQKVREEEKARIARELHDDLGQQLTALKMDVSAFEQALDASASALGREQLQSMRRLIDATVASVRRIAADLRPVMLDDLGLIPAIEWLANDFTNRYGIDVARDIETGDAHFSPAGGTALFRIVQEAFTNVARHADPTIVTLNLRAANESFVLRVADNGKGAHRAAGAAGKSFGLLGVRERAHMLGGAVDIHTAHGEGFVLTVTVPSQAVQLQEVQT